MGGGSIPFKEDGDEEVQHLKIRDVSYDEGVVMASDIDSGRYQP